MADRIEELRRRVEADPGSRLFAQLAEALRKDGELEEAIGVARAGLERHAEYPSARLTLGRALLDSGDPAAARGELEAAVRGAPDNILASRVLGEALETLGELEPALERLKTTLQMAPSDLHVQARIKAIEERLAQPATPAEPAPKAESGHTAPMAAVRREDLPPPSTGAPEAEEGDEEEEALPPTIRIRMPGDPVGGVRAPRPPQPAPEKEGGPASDEGAPPGPAEGGREPEETTLPAPTRLAETEGAGAADGAGVFAETASGLAGGGATEEPRTLPKGTPPAREPSSAEAEESASPMKEDPAEAGAGGEDSDQAPTLPKSKAAEYAGLDPSLPPTVPPGSVTSPPVESGAPREPGPGADTPQASPPSPEAEEASAAGAVAAAPPALETPVAPPPPAAAPEAPAAVPPVVGVPKRSTPASTALEPADHGGTPLSSGTLAELYFQQGLLKRALEVYREVLRDEPDNAKARARLAEIRAEMEASASDVRVAPRDAAAGDAAADGAPDAATDDGGARRQVLERTIEKLEALLATVRASRR